MKKIGTLFLTLAVLLTFTVSINAQNIKKDRSVTTFHSVDLRIAAEVFITQTPNQKLEIEASEDLSDKIIAEVREGTLIIRLDGWHFNYKNVKVYISMAEIRELEVSGSGAIISKSAINSNDLELEISGSGKIRIDNLTVKNLEAEISGSGGITLSGKNTGNNLEFDISGSGSIFAEDLSFKNIEGDISGSGKAKVNATEKLEVDISGSGRVYYKGRPIVDADISGSGSVKKLD